MGYREHGRRTCYLEKNTILESRKTNTMAKRQIHIRKRVN